VLKVVAIVSAEVTVVPAKGVTDGGFRLGVDALGFPETVRLTGELKVPRDITLAL
jgi:hypothetical protein